MNRPVVILDSFAEYLMDEALKESEIAAQNGEVPVGAVIALGEKIIARSHNTTEKERFVGAHAEMNVIREASKVLGNWRLAECVLCVTLEPCTMCCGAIRLSRIPTVIFGAGDSKQGAMGSLYDLSEDERLGTPPRVIKRILAEKCEKRLKEFFSGLRVG